MRKISWLIIGLIVCFTLGVSIVIPVFDNRRSLLDIIQDDLAAKDVKPIGDNQTDPEAYLYCSAPSGSFGIGGWRTVNWSYFKQLFNDHFYKNARYKRYSYSSWTDGTEYLSLGKTWNESGFWKVDIILDVPVDLYAVNVSFGCDLPVLQYVEREGYEVWLNYSANNTETYSIFFNWSDIAQIPNLEISKHRVDDIFYISFEREDVPAGYYVFDPTFGFKDSSIEDINIENQMVGSYSLNVNGTGTADNITVYLNFYFNNVGSSRTVNVNCSLYEYGDYSSTYMWDKIAECVGRSWTDDDHFFSGWYTFNFSDPKPTIENNTRYYLCVWTGSLADGTTQVSSGSGSYMVYESKTYPQWETNWTGESPYSRQSLIYCSYTESGGEEGRTPQQIDLFWFSGGNESARTPQQIDLFWFNGGNIAESQQINLFWFSGGNESARNPYQTDLFWFSGGNETAPAIIHQISNFWFNGGNIAEPQQISTFWFNGGNETARTPKQIDLFWFNGGNESAGNLYQITTFWFSGGNESARTPQQIDLFWFSGGNESARTPQQIDLFWFNGGNIAESQQINLFWFSGGNESARNPYQTDLFWFSGGNETIPTVPHQISTFWFNGGNESAITIIIKNPYPGNGSVNIPLQPTLYVTVNSSLGRTMNITWYSGNSTSNVLGYSLNVTNGTYHYVNYYTAVNYSVEYYWRVMVNDGSIWVNETYGFTTSRLGGVSDVQGGIKTFNPLLILLGIFIIAPLSLLAIKRRKKNE